MLLMWENWTLCNRYAKAFRRGVKRTHLRNQSVCKSLQKGGKKDAPQKSVCWLEDEEKVEAHIYNINSLKGSVNPLKIEVKLDGCSICMEMDTGATISVMLETIFSQLWPGVYLTQM